MRRLLERAVRWLGETLVRLYYPRRSLTGAASIPSAGPAIYLANHPNGLLDPLLIRDAVGRPVRFLAKSTFYSNPFGRLAMNAFASVPVYRKDDPGVGIGGARRNEATFVLCRHALARGEELALFPEGTTHSDPELHALKSGAARIALTTCAAFPDLRLSLVPVGLHYDDKSVFRSAVDLAIGEPLVLGPRAGIAGAVSRAEIASLTREIELRLHAVVADAKRTGLARATAPTSRAPWRFVRAVLLAPAAAVGWVSSYLPYRLAAPLAACVTRDLEVLGTVKLLAGALLLTVSWLLQTAAIALFVGGAAALIVAPLLPACAYAALRFGELALPSRLPLPPPARPRV